ncbi:MAG: hypothetical protein DRP16_05215, partial [Candidatus Aenigmatarchaeota archaeon]
MPKCPLCGKELVFVRSPNIFKCTNPSCELYNIEERLDILNDIAKTTINKGYSRSLKSDKEPDYSQVEEPYEPPPAPPIYPTGSIHGFVWHENIYYYDTKKKVGIPNTKVYILGTGFETKTNAEGFYKLTGIPPGTYTLRIEHYEPFNPFAPNGYYSHEHKIRVYPNRANEYNFELKPIPLPTKKPEKPEKGYHIISPFTERKTIRGKIPAPFFKRRCPICGHRTLVEEYDENTGEIYFRCTNPKCESNKKGERITLKKVKLHGGRIPIFGWRSRERANKRRVYEKRLDELRERYHKGEIDYDKFLEERKKIENQIWHKDSRVTKGIITRFGGPIDYFSRRWGPEVAKGIPVAALIGIGAVVSISLKNYYFFFAFLSWALNVLVPSPDSGTFEEGPMGWGHVLPWAQGGSHAGFAWLKSITKVTSIILFALAFKNMGDMFNIFFILTCLMGYFMLKIQYNPKYPGEFIESLLRFGVLGCYFIPFQIFAVIFNSYVLAAMAFAFFAIPPMPETTAGNISEILARGLSGQTAYYEMFDKLLFLILMFFALIGSGSLGGIPLIGDFFKTGWELTGTLKYTFIYFWLIATIGGFFSPARERPYTGVLMLGGATVIYGIGPGSQEIGSALLGQWWPTVHNTVESVMKPVSQVFSQLSQTFGTAFTLLTNPVGYATQLMNATYAKNPTGKTGAFGVDFDSFDISPVFVKQPYTVSVILKNDGAADAKNLMVFLSAGVKAPKQEKGAFKAAEWSKPITIEGLGIKNCEGQKSSGANNNWAGEQWEKIKSWFAKLFGREPQGNEICEQTRSKLTKQDIWQVTFMSTGITCDAVINYNLRKKFIPFNVTVMYDYESNSNLKIEFVSNEEWEKLIRTGEINRRLRFIQSECSSAPVKLSIGTPGLKNPLKEDQEFYIGINLGNEDRYGQIVKIDEITLNLPKEFSENFDITDCTFEKTQQNNRIVWKGLP